MRRIRTNLHPTESGPATSPEVVSPSGHGFARVGGEPTTSDERERVSRRACASALVERRARSSALPVSPAQRAWANLLDGAWRLVDYFERDGRIYLLARRSHVRAGPREVLTPAETVCAIYVGMGHPQKLIAAELGVSESTTSTHVRRAMRKLGLTSRTELARIFGNG